MDVNEGDPNILQTSQEGGDKENEQQESNEPNILHENKPLDEFGSPPMSGDQKESLDLNSNQNQFDAGKFYLVTICCFYVKPASPQIATSLTQTSFVNLEFYHLFV